MIGRTVGGRPAWPCVVRSAACVILVLVASTACTWGTTPTRYARTMNAAGSRATVTLATGTRMRGELFVVDTAGVIVRGDRLVRIGWARVRQVEVLRPARLRVSGSAPAERRRELALYSRYPQGLSPELLARVLAIAGQDSLEIVP